MVNGGGGDAAGAVAGRVALLTGATSAIGAATARALATAGVRVALAALPSASADLDALAAQIREAGGQALPVPADLGTRTRAQALVSRVVDAWGRLDILVAADGYDAAAGHPSDGASALPRLGQPHPAVRGLLHAAAAALPQMERQGSGDIVVIAPIAGHVLRAGIGGLASARIALEVAALCDNLRRRGGPHGVRVAVVESVGVGVGAGSGTALPPPLRPDDVAATLLFALAQPPHMSIAELLIRSTDERS